MAQMDAENRALCFLSRNQGKGQKKLTFNDIAGLLRNKDGEPVGEGGVRACVKSFHKPKATRGRKVGWRKTTKSEDRQVIKTFLKVRPPGHGVDSRKIHAAMPMKLQKKIFRTTVIRRVGEKGYMAQKKVAKSDPGPALATRRVKFSKDNDRTASQWKQYLQGVGDIKQFTWYPTELRPKMNQLRASWTYMRKDEKYKPAFVRPKRWFKKSDWKKTKMQKVFGMTTSTGKCLAILLPKPFTAEKWAVLVKTKVFPFLKKCFPQKRQFRLLLDGEKLLHAPPVKAAMKEKNICFLEGWCPYSPDLNPQENVWPLAENAIRKAEKDSDTYEDWQKHCLNAVKGYEKNPGAKSLISSIAGRLKKVVEKGGAMLKK